MKGGKPQIKGTITRIYVLAPKKPNSALRKVVKVNTREGEVVAYVPGERHTLNMHNIVLIRPGRTQDLPGVRFKVIRGKYDAEAPKRSTSRSKYGVKKN